MSLYPDLELQEPCFVYAPDHLAWLKVRDARLAQAIEALGPIRRRVYPDLFTGFMRVIIGQQISGKALDAIWSRFIGAFGQPKAENIASQSLQTLRELGLSQRKAEYLHGIAEQFAAGILDADGLDGLDDEKLIDRLIGLRGVGRWTAEMLLIFTFQRQNVLSFADLGIRRGMCLLYGYDSLDQRRFAIHKATYAPHATLAAFYLWEVAGKKRLPAQMQAACP